MRSVSVLALLVAVTLGGGRARATPPVDGGSDAAAAADERLRVALVHCGPGDALAACVDALDKSGVAVAQENDRAVVALGGPFFAVAFDARGGARIVDVVFRGMAIDGASRGRIARYLDEHAGGFAFSETCKQGDPFCGVFYPKQRGGAASVEIGVGLMHVTGKPAWRKPPPATGSDGKPVYARGERILDVEHTASDGIAVQFSLPLGPDGKPAAQRPLLRPAFDAFVHAPFVELP